MKTLQSFLLQILVLIQLISIFLFVVSEDTSSKVETNSVKVFHYILGHWGTSYSGLYPCGNLECEWIVAPSINQLKENYHYLQSGQRENTSNKFVSLSLYNIHTLWEKHRDMKPHLCELATNLTMYETEESAVRYYYLFDPAKQYYDGYSSTSPSAAVQRVYTESFLNSTEFLPLRNFSSLIKAGAYVASDCHRRDSANANRDHIIQLIRNEGFRIDGLGKCMHTPTGPEGVSLSRSRDTRYNLDVKRSTINHFMFYFAFENSIEPGYVTEKPFDALIAGVVPVYLGDAAHLRNILPHPDAAIFVADYENNITALASYLQYLTNNEAAYERHRSGWRNQTSFLPTNPTGQALMNHRWNCRICQWAHQTVSTFPTHRTPLCIANTASSAAGGATGGDVPKVKLPPDWEHKALRSKKQRQVYYVKDGILHAVPDFDTFVGMKLQAEQIQVIEQAQLDTLIIGDPLPRMTG